MTVVGLMVAGDLIALFVTHHRLPAHAMPRWGLLAAACGAYFALRVWLSGYKFAPTFWSLDNPASFADSPVRQLSYCYLQGFNVWLLLWPQTLSADYSFDAIPLLYSCFDLRCLAPLALYLGLAATAAHVMAKPRHPSSGPLAWAWVWLVLPFLPAAHILATGAFVVAERLLYMPSVGLCLALGHGCTVWGGKRRARVVGLLLAVTAARTLARSRAWSAEETTTNLIHSSA